MATDVAVQFIMLGASDTPFVMLSQAIQHRRARLDIGRPQFISLAAIGASLFPFALARVRKTLSTMT